MNMTLVFFQQLAKNIYTLVLQTYCPTPGKPNVSPDHCPCFTMGGVNDYYPYHKIFTQQDGSLIMSAKRKLNLPKHDTGN